MTARGTVLWVDLDPVVGHEQARRRPCVVVSNAGLLARLRFPMVAVVPLTSTRGFDALFPVIDPSRGNGLANPSTALVDNVRGVDPRRARSVVGTLDAADLHNLDAALRLFLGL